MGFFEKLKQGLTRTVNSIGSVFTASELDNDFYDELEESLILADIGVETATKAVERLRAEAKSRRLKTAEDARACLREILAEMLNVGDPALRLDTRPSVVLVIGVNGVGKTTTIGKIANQLRSQGKKVLLCAADTFRAAAADQLEVWAERAHVDIIRQDEGADPAAVVFDAIAAAKARGSDVIICDTAGRLHNKQNLMNELGKISRILSRSAGGVQRGAAGAGRYDWPERPYSGKAVPGDRGRDGHRPDQARRHRQGRHRHCGRRRAQIPVKYVGVGEKMDDLMPFDADAFVKALIG